MTIIAVEILSYSVITSIALYQIHSMGTEIKQMANLYIPLLSDMETVRRQIQDERLNFKDVVFHGDRVVYDKDSEETYIAARTHYQEAGAIINERIAFSEQLIEQSMAGGEHAGMVVQSFAPRLLERLNAIRKAHEKTADQMKRIFAHVEDGSFLMGMELVDGVTAAERQLLSELDRLESDLQELKTASADYAVSVERTSSMMTIISSILTVCVVIAVFFLVVKGNISRPLHALTDAIKSFDLLDEKTDSREVAALMSRGDELGMVGRSLNDLKRALRTQGRALRAAKDAAEHADLAKSRFLAAASHDLRQPLHAMQMYLAALGQRIHDNKTLAILSDTQAVALATGRLLNSLLDISQLEAGAVTPQHEDFRVQELFNRVTISFLPLSYKKGLMLHAVPTKAVVHSDPALLERIVGNYLSNAIRYTNKGKVLLGCRSRGGKVAIQVWDSGPGIPSDKAKAIFEDFHQLHNEERDRSKGLGLGLAIVRRLADSLGHEIEHSSALGKGSYFGIVAKRGIRAPELDKRDELLNVANDLAGTRVLLIEDDKAASDATALLLRSWKCTVWCARTTETALETVRSRKEPPNIVIADYRLPGGHDGVEAVQQVQFAVQKAIPAIIVTGESDLTAIRQIEQTGFMILRKPVRPAKLRRLISHHILEATFSAAAE
ncbi:MAG: hybrid sensor histidine kinase/response regulator [Parvibaculaceae bacterium]